MKNPPLDNRQTGFITMIVLLILIIVGVLALAWWRVADAKHNKQHQSTFQPSQIIQSTELA